MGASDTQPSGRERAAAFAAGFFSPEEGSMTPSDRWPGAHSDTVQLAGLELRVTRFDPDATVPVHTHEWNSALVVLEGQLEVKVDGASKELAPGEVAAIPAGAEHGVSAAGAGVRMVDLWWPLPDSS